MLAALVGLMAAITIVLSGAGAQTPPPLAAPFNPSFGDLMNTLVQPRHAKLGLIGREQNWTLAAYESHQLKTRYRTPPGGGRGSEANQYRN